METPSSLPSVMQAKLAAMKNDATVSDSQPPQTQEQPQSNPPQTQVQQPASNNPTGQEERVTLSREEYNELQANAGRAQSAMGRESLWEMERQEMQQRLTELEGRSKGSSNPASSPASGAQHNIDTSGVSFSDEEQQNFGESRQYIEKIVTLKVAEILNNILPELHNKLEEANSRVNGVATTFQQNSAQLFHSRVTEKVPDLLELIKNKHWEAFLDSIEPAVGRSYDVVLADAIKNQRLESVVYIYNTFKNKYVQPAENNSAFAGAPASGNATTANDPPSNNEKLKLSNRKKASEDYRKGKLTYEQLQEIDKKFKQAEALGNVDFNA